MGGAIAGREADRCYRGRLAHPLSFADTRIIDTPEDVETAVSAIRELA
jgi:hypothetical protein